MPPFYGRETEAQRDRSPLEGIALPILQMRKCRLRKDSWLAQDCRGQGRARIQNASSQSCPPCEKLLGLEAASRAGLGPRSRIQGHREVDFKEE